MNFAFFPGCKIPYYLEQYGRSTRAVLAALGVSLVDIEFNCCGYPVRHLDFDSYLLSAARNLALAEAQGLDLLTPCKCCFGSLKQAEHLLRTETALKEKVAATLDNEGLVYHGHTEVKHLLSVLAHDVGFDNIKARVKQRFKGLKVAPHYGCHALRPSSVTKFDDPFAPTIFEHLLQLTGAEPVTYDRRLDCCGHPVWGKNDQLSLDLMNKKLSNAKEAGADYVCVACTYCQIQFDTVRAKTETNRNGGPASVLYSQLLGLSLGLPERDLGLDRNAFDLRGLTKYLP